MPHELNPTVSKAAPKKIRRARPTPTQAAKSQEQAYASQGRAVKVAARQQRRTAATRRAAARVLPSTLHTDAQGQQSGIAAADRFKKSDHFVRDINAAAKAGYKTAKTKAAKDKIFGPTGGVKSLSPKQRVSLHRQESMGLGADLGGTFYGNTLKDAKELVTGTPASVYLTGHAVVKAAKGDPTEVKALADNFVKNDPLALAAQGKFKQAGKAAFKRPVSTALELSGGEAALGKGLGAVARHAPSSTIRDAASLDRAPQHVYHDAKPGEGPSINRRYSKNLLHKGVQVAKEKRLAHKGIDPNVKPEPNPKLVPSVGPLKHPLDDRVDRHVHADNAMRHHVVSEAEHKAAKEQKRAAKEPQVAKAPTEAELAKVHTLRNPAVQGLNPEHVAHHAHDVLGIKKPVVMRLMPARRQQELTDVMGKVPRAYTTVHDGHYKIEINPQHPGNKGPKGVSNAAHYELGRVQGEEHGKVGPGAVGSHDRQAYFDNKNTQHAQDVLAKHVGTDLTKPHVPTPELPKQVHAAVEDANPISAAGQRAAQAAHQTSMRAAAQDFAIMPIRGKAAGTRATAMKYLPGHEARTGQRLIPVNQSRLERVPIEGEPIKAPNAETRRLQFANANEKAWRDATEKNQPGKWVLYPERVVNRYVEHAKAQNHGAVQKTANAFKDVVLTAVNPAHWLASNAADLGMRSLAEGLTPGDLYRGARLHKELGKRGRRGELVRASTMGGGYGHMARDVGRDITTPGVHHAAKIWGHYRAGVYHIESAIESLPQIATAGKEMRTGVPVSVKSGLKGLLRATDDQVQHFATKMTTDPAHEAMIAKHVEDVIGKWGKLSPEARHWLAVAPFAQWLGAATKYVLITLPSKHPVKTGILSAINGMTQPERAALGLSQYLPLKNQAQDYQMQVIPQQVGKNKYGPTVKGVNPTSMLSFGTAADALDLNVGGFLGPQVSGAMEATKGVSYTGEPLVYQSGPNAGMPLSAADKRRAAVGMLAEAFIPGANVFRRVVQEKGQPSMPQSTILHPEVRLKYNAATKQMEKPKGPSSKGAKKLLRPFPTQTVFTKGAVASMGDTKVAIRKDAEWNANRKKKAVAPLFSGKPPAGPFDPAPSTKVKPKASSNLFGDMK